MVEWGALEKRCGREVTVGSNPTLSAQKGQSVKAVLFCCLSISKIAVSGVQSTVVSGQPSAVGRQKKPTIPHLPQSRDKGTIRYLYP